MTKEFPYQHQYAPSSSEAFSKETGIVAAGTEVNTEVMTTDRNIMPGREFSFLDQCLMLLHFPIPAFLADIDLLLKKSDTGFIFALIYIWYR